CFVGSMSGGNFGNYNPYSTTALTTVITGTYVCTTTAVVSASAGSSGTFTARIMRNGAEALAYNLYTDATYTTVLGDGTGGSGTLDAPPGLFASLRIYARAPALQDVAVGTYSDTIVVTFTF
ncbi:MAG TPA: spore coat protein U domain-containing protein, partial [Myxococcales bacterium]|nr:spore coat protein U domain-containing protein [Myxococcales bacterium]